MIKQLVKKSINLMFLYQKRKKRTFLAYMPNSKAARWTTHFTDVIPKDGGKNTGIDAVIAHFWY